MTCSDVSSNISTELPYLALHGGGSRRPGCLLECCDNKPSGGGQEQVRGVVEGAEIGGIVVV